MSQDLAHSVTFPAGLILGSAVAIAALLAWLAGLMLVMRGSKPAERASILRAYASCRLPFARPAPGHAPWTDEAHCCRAHDSRPGAGCCGASPAQPTGLGAELTNENASFRPHASAAPKDRRRQRAASVQPHDADEDTRRNGRSAPNAQARSST
jgi:hypothetical protein